MPVEYGKWQAKKQLVKNREGKTVSKDVYAIYKETETFKSALEHLQELIPDICTHIYVAHQQWSGHKSMWLSLDENSVITVEDYQMNIELEYTENPTSLAYSTNKQTYALYPIGVEYIENGNRR